MIIVYSIPDSTDFYEFEHNEQVDGPTTDTPFLETIRSRNLLHTKLLYATLQLCLFSLLVGILYSLVTTASGHIFCDREVLVRLV